MTVRAQKCTASWSSGPRNKFGRGLHNLPQQLARGGGGGGRRGLRASVRVTDTRTAAVLLGGKFQDVTHKVPTAVNQSGNVSTGR